MKFECSADQLLNAVGTAVRFVERRPNLPVLSSILLTAEGSQLVLRSTNLECGVEVVVAAKVQTPGIIAVPGNVLYGFLSNARSKTVSGAVAKEVLMLETERARASVKTVPHEDFPLLPKVSASTSFSIKAQDFVRAIRAVVFCASTSAVKPELQSVLVYAEGGKLTAVATDSFRLAEKTVSMRAGGSVPNLLIPARNAAELVRIMEGASGEVEVYYNENQLATHVEQVYYTSRLLDGTFPNYKQIIPKAFETEAVCLREDVASSLKALSVFADKFAHVSLEVNPKQKAVTLTSRNPDVGEQTSTIKATIRGEGMVMSFSARYLADSLQSISGDSVRLQMNGAGKPMLIKDAADDSYLYLAMPMNR